MFQNGLGSATLRCPVTPELWDLHLIKRGREQCVVSTSSISGCSLGNLAASYYELPPLQMGNASLWRELLCLLMNHGIPGDPSYAPVQTHVLPATVGHSLCNP